jgi:hypothetical protein
VVPLASLAATTQTGTLLAAARTAAR